MQELLLFVAGAVVTELVHLGVRFLPEKRRVAREQLEARNAEMREALVSLAPRVTSAIETVMIFQRRLNTPEGNPIPSSWDMKGLAKMLDSAWQPISPRISDPTLRSKVRGLDLWGRLKKWDEAMTWERKDALAAAAELLEDFAGRLEALRQELRRYVAI